MANREFIETREIVYVNAPISPILQGDSVHYEDIAFKAQIGRIHSFSEQEIVKPYLEKLKADIEVVYDELDDYSSDSFRTFASRVEDLIDNLLSESENK